MLLLLVANLIILPVAISFFNDDLIIFWVVWKRKGQYFIDENFHCEVGCQPAIKKTCEFLLCS